MQAITDSEMYSDDLPGLVNGILQTYDLPQKIKGKIFSIAVSRSVETGDLSFDNLYAQVAELAEQFSVPYKERFFTSLDSPIAADGKTTFAEITGLSGYDAAARKEGLSVDEILNALQGHIGEPYINVLRQLAQQTGMAETLEFSVSIENILRDCQRIQENLDRLVLRYFRNGSLLLPANREVIYVESRPSLEIKFGPMRRGSKPYTWVSKDEIAEIYRLSKEKVIDVYPIYNGDASEAAKNLPYKITTIKRYWRIAGLEVRAPQHGELTGGEVKEIIKAYPLYGPNASEAARHFHASSPTISRYWRAAGLMPESEKKRRNRLSARDKQRIIESHSEYGPSAWKASVHLGYSHKSIRKIWRGANLETLEKPKKQVS